MATSEDNLWKTLEKPKYNGLARNLSSKENIIHEHFEHYLENQVTDGGELIRDDDHQCLSNSFDSPTLDEPYDDPFDGYNEMGTYDKEVEIINTNGHMSREFSLSQYDLHIRHYQGQADNGSHGDECRSPSELNDEGDCDEEYEDEGEAVTDNAFTNKLYFEGRGCHGDDTGSGHVICDCEECISHTEAVTCQCENCVEIKDRTRSVTHTANPADETCTCEECLSRWNDPEYSCNCPQCCLVNKVQGLNNNVAKTVCKCPDCVSKSDGSADACECLYQNEVDELGQGHFNFQGHRSPPQGSSQEYPNFDIKTLDSEAQLDTSFDSGTERSYRSSLSRGSHSSTFARTKGSDSGRNNLEMLTDKIINVQLHDYEGYCNNQTMCSNKSYASSRTNSARSNKGNNSDTSFDDGSMSNGESTMPLPRRHLMSSPVHENITGLLEQQLQKTESDLKKKTSDYETEIKELRRENDKQNKLIQQNLSLTPDAKIEATMQHEISRLTSENLDLREMIDKQAEQIRKLKKMVKVYAKRMKDSEAAEIQAELEHEETKSVENVAQIKHRERNYMGMLEYKKEDENAIIKLLIIDLKPKITSSMLPGLPSYLLFMCVRHTDYINDDEKVRTFLTNTINGIKKVVKKHHDDLDRVTLWLANTCRFLHTLKQYSGEKQFQTENTTRQNEHCLRNFDLAEYRQVFSDLAVWIYQTLIKLLEATIQPSIVSAVLEHEAIAGLTGSKPSGLRGRSSSRTEDTPEHSLDALMKSMNMFVTILNRHAVDPELIKQIFRQLYYFLGASALNNLLLRKDMCNWSKGMQIRYNLSYLEQWLRDSKLQESGAGTTLDPIIQASQLLQARKTDADVDSVCDMCSKLAVPQIVKILNLYTPVDEFEERVPISFIRKIQQKLKERENTDSSLLMDLRFSFSVTFPFNPSKIALESIDVPDQLNLGQLVIRL